jgi:hypothetical protein
MGRLKAYLNSFSHFFWINIVVIGRHRKGELKDLVIKIKKKIS